MSSGDFFEACGAQGCLEVHVSLGGTWILVGQMEAYGAIGSLGGT